MAGTPGPPPPPGPGPGPPPPGGGPLLPPIIGRPGSNAERFEFVDYNTAGLEQLADAPNQITVYNREEEELYGKRGRQSWSPVDIPLGVMGTGMNRFYALISGALEFLAEVKRQGVPRWSGKHAYLSRARAVGSDNRMYKSLVRTDPRHNNVQDPVTEAEPRRIWALDEPESVNTGHDVAGHVVAGGQVNADGSLVAAKSWGVGRVRRAGNDPDSYIYTIILDAGVGVDDEGYHVQVAPLADVTDMEIIPIVPSTPPCFTVQFEKRVSQTVVYEGVTRRFSFVVYAK